MPEPRRSQRIKALSDYILFLEKSLADTTKADLTEDMITHYKEKLQSSKQELDILNAL